MSDYGMGLSSNSRKHMKSPGAITANLKNTDEIKHLKKKYQQAKQSLAEQKQQNFRRQKQLQEMKQRFLKREKQLQKKDSIHQILLQQIKTLQHKKQQILNQCHKSSNSIKRQKSPQRIYNQQCINQRQKYMNLYSTTSQQSSKEISHQKVGGYFSKVFK